MDINMRIFDLNSSRFLLLFLLISVLNEMAKASDVESEKTILINEILVIFTFGVILVSITTCVVMYIFRDFRHKEASPPGTPTVLPVSPLSPAGEAKIVSRDRESSVNKSSKERSSTPIRSSGLIPDDDEKLNTDTKQNDKTEKFESKDIESAPFLQEPVIGRDSQISSLPKPKTKRELNPSFLTVIRDGVTLILHSSKSSRAAKVKLSEDQIVIKVKKILTVKVLMINLSDILSIEYGKVTTNFQRSGLQRLQSDSCFSILTADRSYDLEASGKVERDALVEGLGALTEDSQARAGKQV